MNPYEQAAIEAAEKIECEDYFRKVLPHNRTQAAFIQEEHAFCCGFRRGLRWGRENPEPVGADLEERAKAYAMAKSSGKIPAFIIHIEDSEGVAVAGLALGKIHYWYSTLGPGSAADLLADVRKAILSTAIAPENKL